MIVTVTGHHLCVGQRGNPRECPVALAVTDAVMQSRQEAGDFSRPEVLVMHYTVLIDGEIFRLPWWVTDKIVALDGNKNVEPFSFELGKSRTCC